MCVGFVVKVESRAARQASGLEWAGGDIFPVLFYWDCDVGGSDCLWMLVPQPLVYVVRRVIG